MVIKFIESSYDTFKTRLSNPFYGTLFIVWIIRNREFVYNIFFNPDCSSDERLETLRQHFLSYSSILSFLGTIIISLGLMILIYLSLNLSRLIVQASEKKLKPMVLRLFDNTSVVSREDYNLLTEQRDYYFKRYNDENKEKLRLQEELDRLKNIDRVIDGGEIPIENSESNKINELAENWYHFKDELRTDFTKLIELINRDVHFDKIDSVISNESMNTFLARNMIKVFKDNDGFKKYRFTDYGMKFRDSFIKLS